MKKPAKKRQKAKDPGPGMNTLFDPALLKGAKGSTHAMFGKGKGKSRNKASKFPGKAKAQTPKSRKRKG